MNRREYLEDYFVVILPLLCLIHAAIIDAGTSSTPKNLVNLYTHSPNDNSSSLNQFQNEYQYRQGISKPTSPERYKASTPSTTPDAVYDHLTSDISGSGSSDYSYQDNNRGTTNVPDCKGRLKLNGTKGYITDGPGFYQTNLQCIWLIDSGRENASIRIQIHQFNTECNYDYLYIFDGGSIYSPLVASLSGDMKDFSALLEARLETSTLNVQNDFSNSSSISSTKANSFNSDLIVPTVYPFESRPFEIKTISGKAFIYFHSDTAQSMPGFSMTYTIDACPSECSNKGDCDYSTLTCRCYPGYYGSGCQFNLCPNNCTSPIHGACVNEKSCICNKGFQGPDCSVKIEQQSWVSLRNSIQTTKSPSKAFHQAIIVDEVMWIIGGKSQALSNTNMGVYRRVSTPMISSFDLKTRMWSDFNLEGITGIDHLAELSGHSVAAKGHKIFIFGGMAMSSTILDSLTVLDTRTNSLSSIPNGKDTKAQEGKLIAPVAAVGHSANIIDSHMYIFLGYNPLYGYLNFVQKFNLANNSWSFVEKKGSSIEGCIGHTSTYDPVERIVFIYGGHSSQKLGTLYAFDPHTEVWTFLQSGPSPRYYHKSVIINRQLLVLGGNSYNTSHQSDQCFQQTYLSYDLTCSKLNPDNSSHRGNSTITNLNCGRDCWRSIEDPEPSILKRHGHSVVNHDKELILFGGFNGVILNDIRFMNISTCDSLLQESDCVKPKLVLNCYWNAIEFKCEDQLIRFTNTTTDSNPLKSDCTKSEIEAIQHACKARETCTDCLNTNIGCVWCGMLSQCQYNKCKSPNSKTIIDTDLCHYDEFSRNSLLAFDHSIKSLPPPQDLDNEMECKRLENCVLCQSKANCLWQNDGCSYSASNLLGQSPTSSLSSGSQDEFNDAYNQPRSNSNQSVQRYDPFHKSFLAALTNTLMNPFHSCDTPCYMRRSCNECTTTKCIWCSTTEQCVDSSAYFAYYAMGQCMHYVAHMLKCPVASCADIETCDRCLTNPKCGWLNDISNTGRGRCIEGTISGPSLGTSNSAFTASGDYNTSVTTTPYILPNWFYTSCPTCQCNGHSYCKPNNGVCMQPCQDYTEGKNCEKCVPGYYGDPVNGGSCRPCRCNGHAQSCNRETGKCYCSTKGIIGHTCSRCDDQNHYIGDPSGSGNGTCYYNLTTDYQYTFNMSKPEDHFYSDINFINVPLRKDSDVDFTIACSRLALVNITSGTSYRSRKPIHTSLECNSFRLRFSHDRHILTEANYSFFVHVYKFQTPFILQIAFSQHRTLYLPQFFFTFSSCFLFFFALSGLVWKLKHEYDLYVRRQRQFIEMEQMASRPFSTILLEMFTPFSAKTSDQAPRPTAEPTPISFEPCFGSNIGVLSLFVQLPGKPNLAIGSALVTLNDDSNLCNDNSSVERSQKEITTI